MQKNQIKSILVDFIYFFIKIQSLACSPNALLLFGPHSHGVVFQYIK